jgi:hypothetical protein
MFRLLMSNDASGAVDGNIGGGTHHFRRHIHGELDAAANLWQNCDYKQKTVGGDVSGDGFDHSVVGLQVERKSERKADCGSDGIPCTRLMPFRHYFLL